MTRGRPSKLDESVITSIVKSLEGGNSRAASAEMAGIAPSTLFKWLARARAGDPDFSEFSERLKKAEAIAEADAVTAIRTAGLSGSWQAMAWWLERRRYARWRKREEAQKVEHTFTHSNEAQERKEEICAELARRGEALSKEQLRLAAAWNARQPSRGELLQ